MKKTILLILTLAVVNFIHGQNKKEQIGILNNRVDSLKIAFENENSIKKNEIEKLENNNTELGVQKNNLQLKIADLNTSISECKLGNYLLKDSLNVCLKKIIELDFININLLQKNMELNAQIDSINKINSTEFNNDFKMTPEDILEVQKIINNLKAKAEEENRELREDEKEYITFKESELKEKEFANTDYEIEDDEVEEDAKNYFSDLADKKVQAAQGGTGLGSPTGVQNFKLKQTQKLRGARIYKPILTSDGTKQITGSIYKAKGFRIVIYNGPDKNEALASKNKFSRTFPDTKSYLSYNAPSYKIKIGEFENKNDAINFMSRLIAIFPSSFIANDFVTIKKR